jgi:TfoX/Sxy family transcriptional regulator of competence genes
MKLIKPSPGLIQEFKAMARQLSAGELRKMFGYDAVFVNGNMAVGLWQNTCVAKLPEAERRQLIEAGQAIPFAPSGGHAMGAWLELSEELAHDPEELQAWSERAVRFVATLPPKAPRARAATQKAPKLRAAAKKAPKLRTATQKAPKLRAAAKKTPKLRTAAKKASKLRTAKVKRRA